MVETVCGQSYCSPKLTTGQGSRAGCGAMRTIAIATFSRAEYSSCLPLLLEIRADQALQLRLVVSGTHLSPEFGYTIKEIEEDGFDIDERLEMLLSSDTPAGAAKALGLATISFADSFSRSRPDILVLVGDRYELLAAASAALLFRIPVAHVSGGDVTEGAIDNQVRYAVTMLSSLHFVSMQAHADRLVQLGVEKSRVFVTGDPALDMLRKITLLTRVKLEESLGVHLNPPVLMVTFHPTTLGDLTAGEETEALLKALEGTDGTLIFSSPGADTQGRMILQRIKAFVQGRRNAFFFANLGQLRYYSLMAQSDLMVGNSSSGIWEAPSFGLPVVNIGDRQKGRLRAGNVLDVASTPECIRAGIELALSKESLLRHSGLANPYGDGMAASRILSVLKDIEIRPHLLRKSFA
jgi:UDP-hydrolysing UDP-N-acetyl-D-glucosamine 2-epimerase